MIRNTIIINALNQTSEDVRSLSADPLGLSVSYLRNAYSDYCTITVSPSSMATTITKVDTGDGTSWATVSPSAGTGTYQFRARSAAVNDTGYPRSMNLVISDDAGISSSVTVVLTQMANPV